MSTTPEVTESIEAPQWGFPPPVSVPYGWGARAIFEIQHSRPTCKWKRRVVKGKAKLCQVMQPSKPTITVDILWDRQGWYGSPSDAERDKLAKWFNKKGMALLKKELELQDVTPRSSCNVVVKKEGFRIIASPRNSYGYLYIGVSPLTTPPSVVE